MAHKLHLDGYIMLPSGNLTSLWKITIEIVKCPMKNGWIFHGELFNHQRVNIIYNQTENGKFIDGLPMNSTFNR